VTQLHKKITLFHPILGIKKSKSERVCHAQW
jgi:hypothetical protein